MRDAMLVVAGQLNPAGRRRRASRTSARYDYKNDAVLRAARSGRRRVQPPQHLSHVGPRRQEPAARHVRLPRPFDHDAHAAARRPRRCRPCRCSTTRSRSAWPTTSPSGWRRSGPSDAGKQIAPRVRTGLRPARRRADELAAASAVRRAARPGRLLPRAAQHQRISVRRLNHDRQTTSQFCFAFSHQPPRAFLVRRPTASGASRRLLANCCSRDGLVRAAGIPGEAKDPPPHHAGQGAAGDSHLPAAAAYSQLDYVRLQAGAGQAPRQAAGRRREAGRVLRPGRPAAARTTGSSSSAARAACGSPTCFRTSPGVADELTVIRSMFAESSNHTPATFHENTGFRLNGFPALGSWLSYGLGSETDDLPAFVVLPDPRGLPAGGTINWTQRLSAGPASGGDVQQHRARPSTTCSPPARSPPTSKPPAASCIAS